VPEDIRHEYNKHMAFYGRTFWVDPNKAKEENQRRSKSSGFQMNDNNGQRVRTYTIEMIDFTLLPNILMRR
jgi:hypothetical protein